MSADPRPGRRGLLALLLSGPTATAVLTSPPAEAADSPDDDSIDGGTP